MPQINQLAASELAYITKGIAERVEGGLVILSPVHGRPRRRVLYVNSYGGAAWWEKIKAGLLPPHHLWGCLELVRMGYEVALAQPLAHFYLYRKPIPHDLKLLKTVREWLKPDDIIYCGHNVLYWLPFLKQIHAVRRHVVSLLYAREQLDFSRAHSGIIALNPAAADEARKLAPKAKVARLAWGVDLNSFPKLDYRPESFLSCGRTFRDHKTLNLAAARFSGAIRIISAGMPPGLTWAKNVQLDHNDRDEYPMTNHDLLNDCYSRAAGSLIITRRDPNEHQACGFTNLLEAMAMGRPVILTRTGALATEIDVEREGCGLHVPPEDPDALVKAMETLWEDPARAEAMGRAGRRLCESRYSIGRYAAELHQFFESL